jgi:hypothetical protein
MSLPMTTLEAFAAIPLAAVFCDQTFGKDEASGTYQQSCPLGVLPRAPLKGYYGWRITCCDCGFVKHDFLISGGRI